MSSDTALNRKFNEVMERIGSRPALIRAANAADYFGENAPYRIEDGIGIIDVTGPLSNDRWSWGGTTYGEIQDQLKIAVADPNVKGILLNVNSPGGETDNAFETASLVAQVAAEKPCWSVAATIAYSAAYLLASQTSKIYCAPTSCGVGSIGVYCAHMDMSKMLAQMGLKVTLISAGEGKTDGNPYEPLSGAAYEDIKAEIDRLYGEFVGAVSRGRGIPVADVLKLGARLKEGAAAAISSGLADIAGDLSTAWIDMCNEIQRPMMAAIPANFPTSSKVSSPVAEQQSPVVSACEALAAASNTSQTNIDQAIEVLMRRTAVPGSQGARQAQPTARPNDSPVVKACEALAANTATGRQRAAMVEPTAAGEGSALDQAIERLLATEASTATAADPLQRAVERLRDSGQSAAA